MNTLSAYKNEIKAWLYGILNASMEIGRSVRRIIHEYDSVYDEIIWG